MFKLNFNEEKRVQYPKDMKCGDVAEILDKSKYIGLHIILTHNRYILLENMNIEWSLTGDHTLVPIRILPAGTKLSLEVL